MNGWKEYTIYFILTKNYKNHSSIFILKILISLKWIRFSNLSRRNYGKITNWNKFNKMVINLISIFKKIKLIFRN